MRVGSLSELRALLPLAASGVALGVTSAFVVLAHPVDPLDPPLPSVEQSSIEPVAAADRATHARVSQQPLPADVRAVGSAFVAWNLAATGGAPASADDREALVAELRATLGILRTRVGSETAAYAALGDLRAYQTEAFLRELRRSASLGERTLALASLGGALLGVLERNGWIAADGRPHVPEGVLRARYKLHWDAVVFGLEDCDNAPVAVCYGQSTLPLHPAELRVLLGYLLAHPVVRQADFEEAGSWEAAADRRRLVLLDRLITLDRVLDPQGTTHPLLGDFPFLLSRGALLFRLGQFDAASDHFRLYLATAPRDAIARNWYLAAVKRAKGE